MLRLSDEIKVKDINNRYVKLCRNVMWLIKRNHETVLCNPSSNSELDKIYERNYMLTFAYLMGAIRCLHPICPRNQRILLTY